MLTGYHGRPQKGETPLSNKELTKWARSYVGYDQRNQGHLGQTAPYLRVMRRLIKEVKLLRVALVREVRHWNKLEQEIGVHVVEIELLKAEVKHLKRIRGSLEYNLQRARAL